MASIVIKISNVQFSPFSTLNENHGSRTCVLVRSTDKDDDNSVSVTVPKQVRINGASNVDMKSTVVVSCDNNKSKAGAQNVQEELKPLWDDGYGTRTVMDYVETAMDLIIACDGGPPRWFCPVTCGAPIKDSPVLLYLPGNTFHNKFRLYRIDASCIICGLQVVNHHSFRCNMVWVKLEGFFFAILIGLETCFDQLNFSKKQIGPNWIRLETTFKGKKISSDRKNKKIDLQKRKT